MAIRPSEHANEFVVLAQVRPDPTQAPTGFTVTESKSYVDEFGATVETPPSWDMLPATPGQRDTKTVIESTVESAGKLYTTRLTRSNRSLMPVAWELQIKDLAEILPTFTKSFLLVGAETGSGAAMQVNERHYERWDDSSIAFHHNPNQGGAGQTGEVPGADPYSTLRAYGGRPIYFGGSGTMHEACCAPLDFGSDPGNEPISDHGHDSTHPIWWFGDRHYQRVTLNYGGRALVHRVDYWTFTPTAWEDAGVSGPLLSYRVNANAFLANYFDHAFVIDPATGQVLDLSAEFPPPDPGTDWDVTWDIGRRSLLKIVDGVTGTPQPLLGSGYLAVVMQNLADDLAVGVVLKLEDTDDDPNVFTSHRVGAPAFVSLSYSRPGGTGGTLTENSNVALNLVSKSLGPRRAGWIGNSYYMVTGPALAVFAAITELYTSGALDSLSPTDLPPAVTAGTIFPPDSATAVPDRTVDLVVITGNSQLGVSSYGWLTVDGNPELAKRPRSAPLFGSAPGVSTLDTRKQVWHEGRGRWEPISHGDNASTWGDASPTTFGLETSLMEGLLERGLESVYVLKLGYTGSPLADRAGAVGVWNPPDVADVVITAAVTVTPISGGATIVAASGTFSGIAAGTPLQISGSVGGYLEQSGNTFVGNFLRLGNDTYPGRPVVVAAVSGDGSTLTMSGAAPGGVAFTYHAAAETLTLRFGKLNLKTLAEQTVTAALADLARRRIAVRPRLFVLHTGEADKGQTAEDYQALVEDHVAWLRGLFNLPQSAEDTPPVAIVKLSPHGAGDADADVAAIRSGQDAAAAAINNAFVVETDDLTLRAEGGAWPPASRADVGVHLNPSSIIEIGWRVDLGLDQFSWFPTRVVPHNQRLIPPGGSYYGLVTEVPGDGGGPTEVVTAAASPAEIIAAIDQALAAGVEVVSYTVNGRLVQLRSMDELLRARRYFEGLIVRSAGIRRTRVQF